MLKRSIIAPLFLVVLTMGCGSNDTNTPLSNGGRAATGGKATTGGSGNLTGGKSGSAAGTSSTAGTSSIGGKATGGTPGAGGLGVTGGKSTGGTSTTGGTTTTTGGQATGGATGTTGGLGTTGGTTGTTGGLGTTGGTTGTTGGSTSTGGKATGGTTGTGGAGTTGGLGTTGTGGTVSANGCRVWVANTGTDSATCGSETAPCLTLSQAYNILCPPGTDVPNGTECSGPAPRTVCIKEGTYQMNTRFELRKTRMGTSSNKITIQADPAATTKPHLDFSTQPRAGACGAQVTVDTANPELTGITMNADWTVLKNVEISHANDNCIKVQGANNLVENVVVHHCDDAGIQISDASGYTNSGVNNTILNCDSYLNWDPLCNGENADGFAAKEATATGNVFRGCRSWDNTDDGWDLYAFTSPVTIDNCWAINQASTNNDDNSDGNGFKLGGSSVSAAHILSNLISVGNQGGSNGCGFTSNSNPASMACSGQCAAWSNTENVCDSNITGVGTAALGNATVANMTAATARNADGSLKAITAL